MKNNSQSPQFGERVHLRQMERLSKIHRLLANRKYPKTKTLADLLEINMRTVRRDIAFLRDRLGAPIEFCRKRNGYHYTHLNWEMPLVPLTEGELLAFFIATVSLIGKGKTYQDERLRRALAKVANSLPKAISVDLGYLFENTSFQSPSHVLVDSSILDVFHIAISERETMEFDYYSQHKGKSDRRRANPLLLHNYEGTWYVMSFDLDRQDYRDFHTGRITNIQPTNKFFEIPKSWDKEDHLSSGFGMYRGGKKVDVEIIFDEYQSKWMRERNSFHPRETREELDDGKMKLSFTIGENGLEAVARFCLQYAGNCVAVKPEKLIEILRQKLLKGLDLHK